MKKLKRVLALALTFCMLASTNVFANTVKPFTEQELTNLARELGSMEDAKYVKQDVSDKKTSSITEKPFVIMLSDGRSLIQNASMPPFKGEGNNIFVSIEDLANLLGMTYSVMPYETGVIHFIEWSSGDCEFNNMRVGFYFNGGESHANSNVVLMKRSNEKEKYYTYKEFQYVRPACRFSGNTECYVSLSVLSTKLGLFEIRMIDSYNSITVELHPNKSGFSYKPETADKNSDRNSNNMHKDFKSADEKIFNAAREGVKVYWRNSVDDTSPEEIDFGNIKPFVLKDLNKTMIPLRRFGEITNCTVAYYEVNDEEKQALVAQPFSLNGQPVIKVVRFWLNTNVYQIIYISKNDVIDANPYQYLDESGMGLPSLLIEGVSYLPMRMVTSCYNFNSHWDSNTGMISIIKGTK